MTFDPSVFSPATPLERFFLFVLCLFFLLGIFSSFLLRYKWKSIYDSGASENVFFWRGKTIEAQDVETNERLVRLYSGLGERWVGILPGMLLVIGILGTFIGLMLSLGKLGVDLGDSEQRQDVIQSIGTQFKTSIWGISFNLMFLVVSNIIVNYKKFQSKAFYLANQVARETKKDRIKRNDFYFQRILAQVSEREEPSIPKILGDINRELQLANRLSEQQNGLLERRFAQGEELIRTTHLVAHNTKEVKTAVKDFKASSQELLNGLNKTTEAFVKTSKEFTAAVKNFDENTQSVLAAIKEVIVKLETIIQEFSEETDRIFNDPEHGLKARLKIMQEDLTKVLTSLKDALTAEIMSMNGNIKQMTELNYELIEAQKIVAAHAEQQDQYNRTLEENSRKSRAEVERFIAEILGEEGKLYQSLDRAIQKIYDPPEAANGHLLQGISVDIGAVKAHLETGEHLNELKQSIEAARTQLAILAESGPNGSASQNAPPSPSPSTPDEPKPPAPNTGYRKSKKKRNGRK